MKIDTDGDDILDITLSVVCDDCGSSLKIRREEIHAGIIEIKVDKCDKCTNVSYDDGYAEATKDIEKRRN